VRTALGQFISDVRAGRLDPKRATTLGYLATVLPKSIEVVSVEERLAALEKVLRTGVRKDQQGTWRDIQGKNTEARSVTRSQ
jgi:hypothetical protein